jgi:DNA-binding transcriptional regulator GbsR (MarR family)
MEFWGFKRHMGRVWGVLYMSPEPMSASELTDVLQMSPSALSATLADLSRWGAINKEWVPGQRREYYSAETSIWKMVRRVFEQRELQLVVESAEAFNQALEKIRAAARGAANQVERQRLEFMLRRLEQLHALSQVGERLVRALISGNVLDPTWLQSADTRKSNKQTLS